MFDIILLFSRLHSVTVEVAVLRAELSADEDRRSDLLWLRGVKYSLLTAIECCAVTARHVCDRQRWGPAHDDGDAMRLADEHGVLSADLAASMRQLVRFRDILVHEHPDADDQVLDQLSHLDDLEAYVRAVAEYVGPPE